MKDKDSGKITLNSHLTLAVGLAVTIQDKLAPKPSPEWTTSNSASTSGASKSNAMKFSIIQQKLHCFPFSPMTRRKY